jgi:hypothetical protein
LKNMMPSKSKNGQLGIKENLLVEVENI